MTQINRHNVFRAFAFVAVLALGAPFARAEWRLPAIISDNMVMQCDRPVALWGWTEAGDTVTVQMAGQTQTAVADSSGKWLLRLNAMPASSKPAEMSISSVKTGRKVMVRGILVGEVWLASGQSNMEFLLSRSDRAAEDVKAAQLPRIRFFTTARVAAESPQDDTKGAWIVSSQSTASGFSAVAFFFARELHNALDVPVGIINSSWGGTPVEAWTSMEAQTGKPGFQQVLDKWAIKRREYTPAKAQEWYKQALAKWEKEVEEAKKAGKKPSGRKPAMPANPSQDPHCPAVLFNGKIAPLVPYALRGAIWYQGESNANPITAPHYGSMLTTMIQDWRTRFGQGPFPFLFVQLANYNRDLDWVVVQDEMRKALRFPNTGMAVINDIGTPADIHPPNKRDVGRRLALWALGTTYKKSIEYSGPLFKAAEAKGGQVVVLFDHAAGLAVRGGAGPLKGFTIAGADGKFVPAKADIQNDTVVLSAPGVTAPAAVRYAWAANPDANLVNKEGLPASVFEWTSAKK